MIYPWDYKQYCQSLRPLLFQLFHYVFICSMLACATVATAFGVSAATITVPSGGDLQAAINAAQPDDTIVLQAGATYIVAFGPQDKQGSYHITMKSSSVAPLATSG